MTIHKTNSLLFLLLFISFSQAGIGQESLSYSIGFTTNLMLNNVSLPTNSNPVSFTENKNCIKINNGLFKYLPSNNGVFNLNCIVDISIRLLNLSLYPNPSSSDYVIVKLNNNVFFTDNYLLSVIGSGGRLYLSRKVTINELNNGLLILLTNLPPGNYIVNVSSDTGQLTGSKKLIIIK